MKNDYKVSDKHVQLITQAYGDGVPVKDIIKALQAITKWGKTKARETINEVVSTIKEANDKVAEDILGGIMGKPERANWYGAEAGAEYTRKTLREDSFATKILPPQPLDKVYSEADNAALTKDEKAWESALEFKEAYIYNSADDVYVIPCKKVKSGNVVLHGSKVRSIQKDYVSGNSLNDLARKYSIPRGILSDITAKLGITHDSLPFTNEEIAAKTPEELIKSELESKKFELFQKLEKEQWKNTQADALKWQEFKYKQFDPFTQFLSNWQPPAYEPVLVDSFQFQHSHPRKAFVVGAFDWHFGAREEARYMWKGDEWNLEAANKAVYKFVQGIAKKVENDKIGFDKCVLLMGGDLYNSITGYTSNGTPMNNEYSRDTQFEAIMNALVTFISHLLVLFPQVECHFVRGNHGGTTDIPLAHAIKNYFRTEPRLNFEITSCRTKAVRVKDVLILLDHGASDQAKSLLPGNGKAKESYIQSLFLAHPELLQGVKQKLFIQGDLHHFEQKEYNDFEFFMFGALPCGSQYADTKNFHNRPRQNCLVIDEEGVEQVVHIYVD